MTDVPVLFEKLIWKIIMPQVNGRGEWVVGAAEWLPCGIHEGRSSVKPAVARPRNPPSTPLLSQIREDLCEVRFWVTLRAGH